MPLIAKIMKKEYNTMMHTRTLSVLGCTLALLAMPAIAVAYVTPDELLMQDAFMTNFTPPPTTRTTDDAKLRQQETSRERREREQAEYFAAQRALNEDTETPHAAAPDQPVEPTGLDATLSDLQQTIEELKNQQESQEAKRNQRILDRIADQQEVMHAAADGKGDGKGGCIDGKGTCVINSGAPLNESGPGLWVLAFAIVAALGWTLKRATAYSAQVPQGSGTDIF